MADALEQRSDEILEANARDMEAGRGGGPARRVCSTGCAGRGSGSRASQRTCARSSALPDPVGETIEGHRLENGARRAARARAARGRRGGLRGAPERDRRLLRALPQVGQRDRAARLVDGGALERRARAGGLVRGAPDAGVPDGAISIVSGGDRDELRQIATHGRRRRPRDPARGRGAQGGAQGARHRPRDLCRGGNGHVFVDAGADLDDAVAITVNAKVQRPSTCNAAETLLVHADIAADFLPRALRELRESGVELRVDGRTRSLAGELADSLADADEEDWATEYHALILAVKVVDSVEEAIEHVNRYSSGHSEAIVTGSTCRRRRSPAGSTPRRVRQRLHSLHRRRCVRHGRRDRQLDPEAARARPDRHCASSPPTSSSSRAPDRSASRCCSACASESSEEPSTRRTWAISSVRRRRCCSSSSTGCCSCRSGRRRTARSTTTPGPRRGSRWSSSRWRATSASPSRASSSIARGPSYTSDTLELLRAESPDDELFLILGGDQAAALPTWHEPEKVLERATVAAVERLGSSRERDRHQALAPARLRPRAPSRHAGDPDLVHAGPPPRARRAADPLSRAARGRGLHRIARALPAAKVEAASA